MNILFTCVGRRVGLVQAFGRSADASGIVCKTIGTDINAITPGLYACDLGILTSSIHQESYISELLSIVKQHNVRLVVPTIDTELIHLSRNKAPFQELGAKVLVSEPDIIALCQDKRKAYRFMTDHGYDTPRTQDACDVQPEKLTYPVFLKPWDGSASRGNAVVHNLQEYEYHRQRVPNCLVQELIEGQEYTCDVYVDFQMQVRTVVPRKRIEVRGGEVVKSQTVRHPQIIAACRNLIETLKAGPGVITVQCFVTDEQRIKFIEINPRFGGGVPLSIQAGADFPKWILSELAGKKIQDSCDDWQESLYMLRYDEPIWISESELIRNKPQLFSVREQ